MEIIREDIDPDTFLDEAQSFITNTCPACQAPVGNDTAHQSPPYSYIHKNTCFIWNSGINIECITNIRPCYITCERGLETRFRHYSDQCNIDISADHYIAICALTDEVIQSASFLEGLPEGKIKLLDNKFNEIKQF